MWRYAKSEFEYALFYSLNKCGGKTTRGFTEQRVVKTRAENQTRFNIWATTLPHPPRTKLFHRTRTLTLTKTKTMILQRLYVYVTVIDFKIICSSLLSFSVCRLCPSHSKWTEWRFGFELVTGFCDMRNSKGNNNVVFRFFHAKWDLWSQTGLLARTPTGEKILCLPL